MTLLIKILTSALAASLCVGCANMEMTRSGFLTDYEQLQPAPERGVRFVPDEVDYFEAPDAEWGRYSSVIVDPVEFRAGEDRAPDADEEARAAMAHKFTKLLRKTLGEDFTLTDEPGPDTLRVRAAVTDADCSNIWVNWAGLVLVVPPDMGGLSGELEVRDSETGERLLAMTATREGTVFLLLECFSTWGHARHGMKKWARGLARTMRGDGEPVESVAAPEHAQ